jgi:hypothetical protein
VSQASIINGTEEANAHGNTQPARPLSYMKLGMKVTPARSELMVPNADCGVVVHAANCHAVS